MDSFIYLNPNFCIIQNVYGILLFQSNTIDRDKLYQIDRFGTEIIKHCSGLFTIDEIKSYLNLFYESIDFDLTFAIDQFIKKCTSLGIIYFSNNPQKHSYKLFGNPNTLSPIHLSIELTRLCNVNCCYCYFDKTIDQNIDYNKLYKLFPDFINSGVQVIELTGGEPTLHPDFIKIVTECSKKFSSIAIISNGILLWKFVKSLLECPKDKILFQIDLDGPSSKIHNSISRTPGSFDNIIYSIKTLKAEGFNVKIVMNVYKKNQKYMENTLLLAKSLNVDRFSCAPIINLGKAKNIDTLDDSDFKYFFHKIKTFGKKYPKLYTETVEGVPQYNAEIPHCGAGWKSLTIDPNGNVRVCPLSSSNAHFIGNIFDDGYYLFLQKSTKILQNNKNIVIPNLLTCKNCNYKNFCMGCFVRPYFVHQENIKNSYFSCNWNNIYTFYK